MQETQIQSLAWEDPMETERATHSSILAWKIPWTEELGGLQSMGLQRAGHNLRDRSPGEGNGNPLHYSCLENPMDRGAWWATVQGVLKGSDMT